MVATADIIMKQEIGDFNDLPVKASTTIYEGAMVGDDGSGYARGLVAGDPFRGHSMEQVTCGTTAGAKNVKVRKGVYRLQVAVTGASAVTDVGAQVYGSADNTYTLTKGSNTPVGRVVRWISSTTCIVEFSTVVSQAHQHTGVTDGGVLTSPLIGTNIKDSSGNALVTITAATGSAAMMIGTLSTQKVGFLGTAGVVKQAHIADATSVLSVLKIKVNAILTALETYGLLKTS